MAKARVLVCGATGYLGGHVVRALKEAGHRVRALARDPARLEPIRAYCDEVFEGHATRPETLEGLCADIDVVFSSIGVRSFHRKPTVWDVDYGANRNILDRALEAGVGRFIFVSVFGADKARAQGVAVAEARERVVDALREAPLRETILRPTGFFNDMEGLFEMCRKGRGWTLGDGAGHINPIHGADIAAVVARCVSSPDTCEDEIPLGGPDIFSQRELLELAFEALGREPRIRALPLWILKVARHLARPFNSTAATFIHAMSLMATEEIVAPATGTHHLADHFRALASSQEPGRAG